MIPGCDSPSKHVTAMKFDSLRGSGCGTARIGKRSANVTLVDARMSASRGEHTCVSRVSKVVYLVVPKGGPLGWCRQGRGVPSFCWLRKVL